MKKLIIKIVTHAIVFKKTPLNYLQYRFSRAKLFYRHIRFSLWWNIIAKDHVFSFLYRQLKYEKTLRISLYYSWKFKRLMFCRKHNSTAVKYSFHPLNLYKVTVVEYTNGVVHVYDNRFETKQEYRLKDLPPLKFSNCTTCHIELLRYEQKYGGYCQGCFFEKFLQLKKE